jgi:hypothetical protein
MTTLVPESDVAVDVLHRLSRIADDLPELAELDNSVIGLRAAIVKARTRVARPHLSTNAKSW